MGCCASSQESKPLNSASSSSSSTSSASPAAKSAASGSLTGTGSSSTKTTKEDQIALALRSKRGNVFTESVDADSRRAFSAKNIPKTPAQEQIISKTKIKFTNNYFYC